MNQVNDNDVRDQHPIVELWVRYPKVVRLTDDLMWVQNADGGWGMHFFATNGLIISPTNLTPGFQPTHIGGSADVILFRPPSGYLWGAIGIGDLSVSVPPIYQEVSHLVDRFFEVTSTETGQRGLLDAGTEEIIWKK